MGRRTIGMTGVWRILAVGCVLASAGSAPAGGQDAKLGVLSQIQSGAWELRHRPPGKETERICLRDGQGLIQLRHSYPNCEQRMVENSGAEVAVQYTCRGHGYGLTRIRRETDQLIQIDSQGVVDGQPFSFSAEGRRVGDCAP